MLISYLQVFHIWKRNPNGYNSTGVLITEIQAFADFSSAYSYEERSISNKPERNMQIIPRASFTNIFKELNII